MNLTGEENDNSLRPNLSFLLALLLIILSIATFLMLVEAEARSVQVLLTEDFESYMPGTWPSSGGWEPYYNIISDPSNNKVTNQYKSGGSNSLQIYGAHLGCWAAETGHPLTFPKEFYIETGMMPSGDTFSSSSCHAWDIAIGLATVFGGSGVDWTNLFGFWKDRKAYGSNGSVLNNYNTVNWYNLKMKVNFEAGTVGYWVNENYVGQQFSQTLKDKAQNYKYLYLGSGSGKDWVDNVKAYTPTITWNKNPTFDDSPPKNWKRLQYKWSNDGSCFGELDENKFWGEEYGGAYGKNALTNYQCYGIITYREGNVWDNGWNPNDMSDLSPLKTYGKQIDLNISVKRVDDGKTGPWWFNSRMMYAVNIWFNSSELSKPLVMDIIYDLGHFDYYGSFEDNYAYHYQLNVPYNNNFGLTLGHYMNKGQWYKFHTDVDWHIKNALCNLNGAGFNICYAVDTLELQQAEILLELQGAWGEFEVDNFYINYSS